MDSGSPASAPAADAAGTEAALLARVAGGDRGEPLRALYDRYSGRLYGLGIGLLGDRGLAEELVQETFVRIWRRAGQFDPARGSASSFVFTIARRIAVDLWRRPSSRPFHPEPAEEAPAPGDPVERVLVGISVRDAMRSLTPAHREVLELSYRGDLRQREIADRLCLPIGTVKTRTYHALRALRVALLQRGVGA